MTTRWLAGLAIFALGFGCAHVMRVTPANAADTAEDGMLDEGLQLIEHDEKFELVNSGIRRYLLVVKRKDGTTDSEPDISSAKGSASVSKEGLESLTVIRLVALAELTLAQPPQRECRPDFQDCWEPDPLLPPRPPKKVSELMPPY